MVEQKCCGNKPNENETIKDYVKEKYGEIARNAGEGRQGSCCDSGSCCSEGTSKDAITRDLYTDAETEGIPVEALLASMGCANPLAIAQLNEGEVVLDLGSGGGIDVLLSAKRVGPTGKAYGLDMTDDMLALARRNQAEAGVKNVEFLRGEIENIPLPSESVDVIISNCVINLSTDKDKVLKEAFRVLKPGGRFAVADIVLLKPLSEKAHSYLALWAGCVAGALQIEEYKQKLTSTGFAQAEVEMARSYSHQDAKDLVPSQVADEVGEEALINIVESVASAFIRATKPKKSCCCG